jgi:hypothetical protein
MLFTSAGEPCDSAFLQLRPTKRDVEANMRRFEEVKEEQSQRSGSEISSSLRSPGEVVAIR